MKKFLFLLIGIFLLSFNSVLSEDIPISNCAVLDQRDAVYRLSPQFVASGDITTGENFICIKVTAENVVLDCNGLTIDGKNIRGILTTSTDTFGIYPTALKTTIKNCNIVNWGLGIYYSGVTDGIIEGNSVSSCKTGIGLSSQRVEIKDNKLFQNRDGISYYRADQSVIENNIIENNNRGISDVLFIGNGAYQGRIDNAQIINNKIKSNSEIGIKLRGSNNLIMGNSIELNDIGINALAGNYEETINNKIYNNLFNNDNNFNFWNFVGTNYWSNDAVVPGTPIYGPGKNIGGNYWTKPEGKDHSDTCHDENLDCICDEPYPLDEHNEDKFPLTFWCVCPEKGCYSDQTGEYVVSKDPSGFYTSTGAYEKCRYSKADQPCKTGAEDSPPESHSPHDNIVIPKEDLTEKGRWINYKGCVDGECKQDNALGDYCVGNCLNYREKIEIKKTDVNHDGKVNILDVFVVAQAFGSKPGEPSWNAKTDFNNDGTVNILDIFLIAKYFGSEVDDTKTCYLFEYYVDTTDGTCKFEHDLNDLNKGIDCSQKFNEGPLNGAEWTCKKGACEGCKSDNDCPSDECRVTSCSDNKCSGKGHKRDWYCDSGYCKYTNLTDECEINVEPNKVCSGNGGQIDATETYSCRADNKPVPFCSENSCSGYLHYAECDGNGNCDMSTDVNTLQYFESEKVFADSGKVFNTNCQSVEGSCNNVWECTDFRKTQSGTGSYCSKEQELLACSGGGECNVLWTWDESSKTFCNEHSCSNGECTDNCDEACGGCIPGTGSGCGNCGDMICKDDCSWGDCLGEGPCSEDSTQDCGNCGSQTCGSNCYWGGCTGQGVCSPGSTKSCGNCGAMTCGSNCYWGGCTGQGVCSPGSIQDCSHGCCSGTVTCEGNCDWGDCVESPGGCGDPGLVCINCECVPPS
jgi:parallel beta-helix repeat protein